MSNPQIKRKEGNLLNFLFENIKKRAEEQRLSFHQIEVATDIGNGTIAKWGKEENSSKPMLETVVKVAGVLGCTVDDLLKEGE